MQQPLKLSTIFERNSQKVLVKLHFNICAVHFVGLYVIGAPAQLVMIISVVESTAFNANFILERVRREVKLTLK